MRLRTNIPFVAATVLAYLSQAPTTREPLNSHWGAVFPPASTGQLLRQCSRGTQTPIRGTWNQSPDQVRLLDRPLSVLIDCPLSALQRPHCLRHHAAN